MGKKKKKEETWKKERIIKRNKKKRRKSKTNAKLKKGKTEKCEIDINKYERIWHKKEGILNLKKLKILKWSLNQGSQ